MRTWTLASDSRLPKNVAATFSDLFKFMRSKESPTDARIRATVYTIKGLGKKGRPS